MKTKHTIQSILTSLALGIIPVSAAEPVPATIGIYIIEDVSGPEVQKHGIKPADFEDMPVLGDVIFIARTTGLIGYDVVDDNGSDNVPLHFAITPFEKEVPARPDFRAMTVRDKSNALKEFETKKTAFLKENTEWRNRVLEGAKVWFDECVTHRMDVEEIFLKRLKANHDKDYRRSDIIGAIQKANEILAGAKKRFLLLNTDMEHQPGPAARDKVVRALNHSDISQDVIIIMVNTSNKPDQSQILKGLPNRILHAESLQKAAEVITAELKTP
jgi:hypothetical protein